MIRRRHHDWLPAAEALREDLAAGNSVATAIANKPEMAQVLGINTDTPVADAMRAATHSDPDLALLCRILAIASKQGSSGAKALDAVLHRLTARRSAAAESRAMTVQARMSAWAILLLTPGFLLLLGFTDPGFLGRVTRPPTVFAFALGVTLQLLGAAWVMRIIRASTGRPASRIARIPVLRALDVIISAGTRRDLAATDTADSASLLSVLLGAGLTPAGAIAITSETATGAPARFLNTVIADTQRGFPLQLALDRARQTSTGPARRMAELLSAGVSLGTPIAPRLDRLAEDLRRQDAVAATSVARAASVKVLLPLGFLILPAFVMTCMVPLFAGGLSGLGI